MGKMFWPPEWLMLQMRGELPVISLGLALSQICFQVKEL